MPSSLHLVIIENTCANCGHQFTSQSYAVGIQGVGQIDPYNRNNSHRWKLHDEYLDSIRVRQFTFPICYRCVDQSTIPIKPFIAEPPGIICSPEELAKRTSNAIKSKPRSRTSSSVSDTDLDALLFNKD